MATAWHMLAYAGAMKRTVLCAFGLWAATFGCASSAPTAEAAVVEIATTLREFLRTLPPAQRELANRPLSDAERTRWAFVPGRYAGVEFGVLDAAAMDCAQAVLRSLLSTQGYTKTMAIVQLESVLRELEGKGGRDASHRDPGRYTLLVFGMPIASMPFAVRLQGHHVSLHFTFSDGLLVGATPHFLGTNPHELREGPNAGSRVLAAEEDLARDLLASLDAGQRAQAVIADKAPPDVLLGPAAAFSTLGVPRGLSAAAMTATQRAQMWRLVELFAQNLRGEFAERELERLRLEFVNAHFAWAGGSERGQGHYWRVHGAKFAIEYDNTQNDANHVHVVWRDLERDFGGDPMREHIERNHRQQ